MARSPRAYGELTEAPNIITSDRTNIVIPASDQEKERFNLDQALTIANRILNESLADLQSGILLFENDNSTSNGRIEELKNSLSIVDSQVRLLINKLESARV